MKNILITVEESLFAIVELLFKPNSKFEELTFLIRKVDKSSDDRELLSNKSLFNIHFSDEFIIKHYLEKSSDFNLFYNTLKTFLQPFIPIGQKITEALDSNSFSLFSIFYKTNDEKKCEFLFDFEPEIDNYMNAFNLLLEDIRIYNSNDNNHVKIAIKRAFSKFDKYYFVFREGVWSIFDASVEMTKRYNDDYRKNKDGRIKKPHIILNRENIYKKIIFDSNWVLEFDELETMIVQPNDVSIYSSITDKTLSKAEEFYKNIISPRFERYGGAFPSDNLQSQYYDYFELIIAAIIFSHTSLEAFVNIFIPEIFHYKNGEGVPSSKTKEEIEKRFTLDDKLTKVLSVILNTSNPKDEKWWGRYRELKNIRDEIIHTKQSKSEERYSKMLSRDIFMIIKVYKEIIIYYGSYIVKNNPSLLNDYPYNLGYDDIYPGFMSDENYKNTYKSLIYPNLKISKK